MLMLRDTNHERREFDSVSELPTRPHNKTLGLLAQKHTGHEFVKWSHYFDIYDEQFVSYLDRRKARGEIGPLRILEIGVWRGGSLQLWRDYFGESARIFGIEINPKYPRVDSGIAHVRFGSQADPDFLKQVVDEMGGIDIVIDDGSHRASDVLASLSALFSYVSSPGLYIIEDLHTSYWNEWQGGYRRKGTTIEVAKELIDLLHAPYHTQIPSPHELGLARNEVRSLHFYDSLLVIEKDEVEYPTTFHAGS